MAGVNCRVMAGADCRVPAGGENMVFTTQKICSMLLDIFLNTTEPVTAAAVLLFIAGEWGLLKKSGIRGWWALVPCARDYQLARCAGREPAGRTASILSFLIIITNTVMYFIKEDIALVFLVVIVITLNTMLYFYRLQIFGGLTEVYGARLSGGGFDGSCCLLVDPSAADRIAAAIAKEYKAKFGDEPACSLIKPSEGAHLV